MAVVLGRRRRLLANGGTRRLLACVRRRAVTDGPGRLVFRVVVRQSTGCWLAGAAAPAAAAPASRQLPSPTCSLLVGSRRWGVGTAGTGQAAAGWLEGLPPGGCDQLRAESAAGWLLRLLVRGGGCLPPYAAIVRRRRRGAATCWPCRPLAVAVAGVKGWLRRGTGSLAWRRLPMGEEINGCHQVVREWSLLLCTAAVKLLPVGVLCRGKNDEGVIGEVSDRHHCSRDVKYGRYSSCFLLFVHDGLGSARPPTPAE